VPRGLYFIIYSSYILEALIYSTIGYIVVLLITLVNVIHKRAAIPIERPPSSDLTASHFFELISTLPCLQNRVKPLEIWGNKREGFSLQYLLLRIIKFTIFLKLHVFTMSPVQLFDDA
jgi:hypothetical protein